ncbi:MAG: DNA replication protein RecF [Epulopiscium sp. Nuni2H_MBin001]|nr:MAG: DNA replication protein RecF [Epulopiscium sp. Nuni2H_MBin001]
MYIQDLSLTNFRNHQQTKIELGEGINIFAGDNAQGKTNILEAIYLCAVARSHRTTKEKETIKWGERSTHIQLSVQKKTINNQIDFYISNTNKSVAINKLAINKLSDLFGVLNVVMFSPEDLQLIKKSPKERRKFLDIELCQFDKLYYYSLKQYHQVLKQRNNYLKQAKISGNYELISIWDQQLSDFGIEIIKKRQQFIESLNLIATNIHNKISGGQEELKIIYEPNVAINKFLDELQRTHTRDYLMQSTSVGPHRDDIKFLVNNMDAKLYSSQGQQRTVVLALKLAEIEMMKNRLGEAPILLLDDVLSELDCHRRQHLFNYTKSNQTIITCNEFEQTIWQDKKFDKLYLIKNGAISR